MKKTLLTAALTASAFCFTNMAYADFIGANAEAGAYESDDASATYASLDIQHPIPLIPNIRFDLWDSEDDSGAFEVSHLDITGYYGVGLLWVGVEGGVTFRELDMTASGTTQSESVPMLYLGAFVEIPGTSIKLAAESKNISSFDGITITDNIAKIGFEPLPIVGIELGYRSIDQDTRFVDTVHDGYFVGVTIDI